MKDTEFSSRNSYTSIEEASQAFVNAVDKLFNIIRWNELPEKLGNRY